MTLRYPDPQTMNVGVTAKREAAMAQGDRLLWSYSQRPNHNAAPGTRMSTWHCANLRICASPASNQNWWDMSLFLPFCLLVAPSLLIFMVFLLSYSFLFNLSSTHSFGFTASPSDMLTSGSSTLSSCLYSLRLYFQGIERQANCLLRAKHNVSRNNSSRCFFSKLKCPG